MRTIVWFHQDLRLSDNPALFEASKRGGVIPVYVMDDVHSGPHKMGAASRWWLRHSLAQLDASLGGRLNVYRGDPVVVLPQLAATHDAAAVFWNHCYEPWRVALEARLKEILLASGQEPKSFSGSLLWEPWNIAKEDGAPYKVFTPFYRKGCLNAEPPRTPLPSPMSLECVKDSSNQTTIDSLGLLPPIRWDKKLEQHWQFGEAAARRQLTAFLETGLAHYKQGRNFPAKPFVSRLSPYLHFGEISPHQVWHAAREQGDNANVDHFCSELGWREFSYSLLYRWPTLPTENWQRRFDAFPWREDPESLRRWQRGETGYPMVDAGMREVWNTGTMHNRARMIVGSFLTKNLLLDWRHGERWFWDTLVDADLANNSAGWQWVAGSGADAAPFFRIFNPISQGADFDAEGEYIRRFVPELAELPNQYLFSPWEAPNEILAEAAVVLGKTYPWPIVDAKASRQRALDAFATLKATE